MKTAVDNKVIGKEIVDILLDKGYNAMYFDKLSQAKEQVISMIPKGSTLALGGSVTLEAMDFINVARSGDYKFFDRYDKSKPFNPDIVNIHRESLSADYYVTGTNAITKNGELVNVDCTGNRVSAMIFGPKNVIVVASTKKVVENIDEAFKRLREISPENSKRIGHETPCVETGYCMDCQVQKRMCNYTTIIHNGRKFKGRISVIIIGEEVGF